MLTEIAVPFTSTPAKPRVLIVDDEYGPRESIAFTLANEFAIETAERAAEALAKIREREFAVVLLDIRMPEMDGIKALEHIRKIDKEVSVVMLTGYGTLHTAQQAMVGGANQYLRKPPDIVELIEAVRKQSALATIRRQEARANLEAREMSSALKREIAENEPQIWQARAAVELVHDLANPLTVMIGYAGLLSEEAKALARVDPAMAEKLGSYASIVERAAEYCHHLAENWRQATRKATEFSELDLVALAREVKQVIFFSNAAIQTAGLEKALVRGSRFDLARVFQNLYKNALEAGATSLKVTFNHVGDKMEVLLSDNGSGMDAETAKSALKGGFTTKSHGTGLGLSICRHLLGAHGATLSVESELGRGTTFRMVFPAAS
jgi:signal transduction histidine kinase